MMNAYRIGWGEIFLSKVFAVAERSRVYLHLWRVELGLRLKNVSHLSEELQRERAINIDRLRAYRKGFVFPKNLDFPGQLIPYFKDAFGVPCAVAYLMEQSGKRTAVAAVASANNHVYVNDIVDGPVLEWIQRSGLTQEEAARIQPTYGYGGGIIQIPDVPAVFSIVDFILSALANAVAISGLIAALLFLLFRSYISSLYGHIGRKKFFIVTAVTLLVVSGATIFLHYLIVDGSMVREGSDPFGIWDILVHGLYFSVPLFATFAVFGLLKLLVYLPDRKKSFALSLVTYPVVGIGFVFYAEIVAFLLSFLVYSADLPIIELLPVSLNIVLEAGLTIALFFLLFRPYIVSLYQHLSRKKFFILTLLTLLVVSGVLVYSHFFYFFEEGFSLVPSLLVALVIFGLIKALVYLPTRKKSFALSLVTYPAAGLILSPGLLVGLGLLFHYFVY